MKKYCDRDKTRMPAILLLFNIILIITNTLVNAITYILNTHIYLQTHKDKLTTIFRSLSTYLFIKIKPL